MTGAARPIGWRIRVGNDEEWAGRRGLAGAARPIRWRLRTGNDEEWAGQVRAFGAGLATAYLPRA